MTRDIPTDENIAVLRELPKNTIIIIGTKSDVTIVKIVVEREGRALQIVETIIPQTKINY